MAAGTAAAELRGLEDDELVTKLRESKEELFNLRFQSATGQLDNNKRLRTVRHDIARIYTVMRERELGLTAAQLRSSSPEELSSKLAEAKEELFNLRFQGATGQLESHGRLRAVRKEIARIYTVMRERELGIIADVEDVEGAEK